jgi:toluene monooxygenase system protein D
MSPAGVGPVLEAGEVADAIVRAIRETNPEVDVQDRGSYLRVLVPGRCVLERARVERILGRSFALPAELELTMVAFTGSITFSANRVIWSLGAA